MSEETEEKSSFSFFGKDKDEKEEVEYTKNDVAKDDDVDEELAMKDCEHKDKEECDCEEYCKDAAGEYVEESEEDEEESVEASEEDEESEGPLTGGQTMVKFSHIKREKSSLARKYLNKPKNR